MAQRKLKVSEFEKAAISGNAGTVFLALGEEQLMLDIVERAARNIPDESTRDFNLDILYGDSLDVRQVAPALSALPMMTERRVVIIKRAESITPLVQKYITEYARNPIDSTLLLLLVNLDSKAVWISKLAGLSSVVDCKTPSEKALETWATQKASSFGVQIDRDALALLSDSGGRLIDLQGELLKASLLIEEGETITPDVLQRVWGIEEEVNIWSFFDHVASGNRLTSLREVELLKDHISKQSGFFFTQISRRWRLAAKERAYDAKHTPDGQREWNANTRRQWQMASPDVKSMSQSFSEKQLKRMLDLDRERKTRTFDDYLGFAAFVHNISLDRKDAK
ncbi:MAG TPA: DNA polymerase III subunit delta [Bacteroidetes bacterium]|nr:DNA polymerase III subunit delta [bacterium BMS3Bbin04]HDO66200.1 DNA polymerase III subunit delta [Bacteroidota bacterium]HEX05325.1 DNA polymerase III subunit delta [Bacteroidota bacterium]